MRRLLIILSVFGIVSCSDFLSEKVTTSYDGGVMVSTKDALEANVLGIHRQLASSGFKTGTFCEWLSPASGLSHWSNTSALSNPLERWSCLLKFTRFSKHPEGYDSFTSFYRSIYLCNQLLTVLPTSVVEDSYKTEIEGEVHFLRAMAYFYLVRLYGDVSLNTVAASTLEEVHSTRANFWDVYALIIDDLNKAEKQMRSFDRMLEVSGGNASGRVCNYAASACRSLVYLTIGTLLAHPEDNFWVNRTPDFSTINIKSAEDAFKLALADAQNVIENGPFELCSDYRQLFRWTEAADWQLKERIWAMPRSPETNDSGPGLTMWALPNRYMGTGDAANFGRCRPDRWFFQKWCEDMQGSKGTGNDNSNIYVGCSDPRMDVNIVYMSYPAKDKVKMNCYPADNRIFAGDGIMMKHYGMPYYKKYYDPTYDNSTGNSDLYVMRLAEVYLIAAEACANLSSSPADEYGLKAIDYVNVIRTRARNSVDEGPSDQPADWTASTFSDKAALIDGIFWERCYEMPFEHHDYFDTHRMGAKWLTETIAKPKNKFLALPEQGDFTKAGQKYSGYRTLFYGTDFQYDEDWNNVRKGLICAYPYDELIYNSSLDVNINDCNKGQNPTEVYWR